jgi:hypothetical protein
MGRHLGALLGHPPSMATSLAARDPELDAGALKQENRALFEAINTILRAGRRPRCRMRLKREARA